jgi:ComF family protein
MMLRQLADTVLSALLAPPCALCGDVLDRPLDGAVCTRCWSTVDVRFTQFTLRGITQAGAIGRYESTLRGLLHALKYDGRRSIAAPLSGLMLTHGAEVLRGADATVPVPLHRSRRRERGFNQARDLAHGLGLPVVDVLRRTRATRAQVDLPAEARRENVKDGFVVRKPVAGLVVVLIDDVATTGATLEACARALRHGQARDVRALTAARAEIGWLRSPRA